MRAMTYNGGMNAGYLQPYRESHARHGSAFEVTLWASVRTQELRFRVFTEMYFMTGKRLLDAGCARGDLADYLLRHGLEYAHYTGVDALSEVIGFAQGRGLARCEFVAGDFVQDEKLLKRDHAQVILISGALNTMEDAQVFRGLEACWRAASEVLIFNFLSARCGDKAPKQEAPVRRLDPLVMLEWAMLKTSLVSMRQDYFPHGHDATICMRKPGC